MKIIGYSILFILLGVSCIAQEKEELTSSIKLGEATIKIGVFKKGQYNRNFEEGDKILFSFSELKGRSIGKILIFTPSGKKISIDKPGTLKDDPLIASESGNYIFQFHHGFQLHPSVLLPRYGVIVLKKEFKIDPKPKKEEEDNNKAITSFSNFDTIPIKDTIVTLSKSDTSFTELINHQTTVYSRRDIFSKTRNFLEVKTPKAFDYLVYWIGVGGGSKQEYEKLKLKPLLKSFSSPLEAYASGKTIRYPVPIYGEHVGIWITQNKAAKDAFLNGKKLTGTLFAKDSVNMEFGDIRSRNLKGGSPLYVCFENRNEATNLDVFLSVLSVEVKNKYKTTVKDSIIVRKHGIDLNVDFNDLGKAEKKLVTTRKDLELAREQFLKKIEQQHTDLDSLKTKQLAQFDQIEKEIDKKETILQKQKELQEAGATPTEARALTDLELTKAKLEEAEKEIVVLEKKVEAMEKLQKEGSNTTKKNKFKGTPTLKKVKIPKTPKINTKKLPKGGKKIQKIEGQVKNVEGKVKKAKGKVKKAEEKVKKTKGKVKKIEGEVKKAEGKVKKLKKSKKKGQGFWAWLFGSKK